MRRLPTLPPPRQLLQRLPRRQRLQDRLRPDYNGGSLSGVCLYLDTHNRGVCFTIVTLLQHKDRVKTAGNSVDFSNCLSTRGLTFRWLCVDRASSALLTW
jgi:hypothetical protein